MPLQAGPPGHARVTGAIPRGAPARTTGPQPPGPASDERLPMTWMTFGACRRADPEIFFAPDLERVGARREREAEAKAVCARCPVLPSCAAFAEQFPKLVEYGVWAGRSEEERSAGRRRAARQALRLAQAASLTDPCDAPESAAKARTGAVAAHSLSNPMEGLQRGCVPVLVSAGLGP